MRWIRVILIYDQNKFLTWIQRTVLGMNLFEMTHNVPSFRCRRVIILASLAKKPFMSLMSLKMPTFVRRQPMSYKPLPGNLFALLYAVDIGMPL